MPIEHEEAEYPPVYTNLHVQYWEECGMCGSRLNLSQDEADEFVPKPCMRCTPTRFWSKQND